jgi:hypothetical protein
MRIIVDVDDVLSDTVGTLEGLFGKATDPTSENLQVMFPDADVEWIFDNVEFHLSIHPIEGAVAGVGRLLDAGYEAQYLSSRPLSMEGPTKDWLRQWQFPDLPLRCIGRESKKLVLRNERYDLLIDDMPWYLSIAKERGKRTIAFAKPWNSTWEGVRVAGWSKMMDIF